ncbi:hypothetical protein SBOR_4143 [Sclerotinia borealis F-4128]|uniref:DUF7707 domain-containing protein n=1 Tax=Sclerotinia borealis (strain F-4128) TaxID=1432307 RepID=W9CLE9_SCLBF|nr:hypothetical protein SBOR_4143 [Sclerotinia borealis F-4128]
MRVVRILGLVAQCAMMVRASGSCSAQIDPSSVSASLRSQWCSEQITTCGTLCAGNYDANNCDTVTLCYECTCSASSSSPALQYYTQTMPTFLCEQLYDNCIFAGENDAAAQKKCQDAEKVNCGHLNPDSIGVSTSSSSSSSISVASTYLSNKPTTSAVSRTSTSTEASTETAQIISITKTITPTPTGTTTVWSTSTAGSGGNGTAGIVSASGNYSTLPGITDIRSSPGSFSTLPGTTDIKTSGTSTGELVRPSTVSDNGAERMGGVGGVWGVVVGVAGFGIWGL